MSCCINCSAVTKYVCLTCKRPACNKSLECSVPAGEETLGWKAGSSVGWCSTCSKNNEGVRTNERTAENSRPKQYVSVKRQIKSTLDKKKKLKSLEKRSDLRRCLGLSEKVEVIEASLDKKESLRQLATRFSCGKTQISKILANKESIMNDWTSNKNADIKRSRNEKYEEINRLLWTWYNMARQSNIPVDGPLLKEEAHMIAEKLGITDFKGSDGWLNKWKRRYNIKQMSIAGEEGDVAEVTVESWEERIKELMKGYAPRDIWNEDETGSFWKALPNKSLSEKGKRCRGGKNAKQRITAAFFVNAVGEKECPILIGKSKKPRCFSKLKDISRPCGANYFNNAKAWMNSDIMENTVSKLNNKMKREKRHILLFLDNAPCHPPTLKGKFSNIKIEFLPKNTTSRTQPLDAGIIKTWKVHYRKKLVRHVAGQIDGKKTASDIVKSVNLLMAVRWIVSAWDEVSTDAITKCFKRVGMYPDVPTTDESDDDPFEGEELMELQELLSHISPDLDVSDFDDEVDAFEPPVDTSFPNWREELRQEMIDDYRNDRNDISDDEDTENYDAPLAVPEITSTVEALEAAKKLAEFSEWQGDEMLTKVIGKMNDLLLDKQLFSKNMKQSSILQFLSK